MCRSTVFSPGGAFSLFSCLAQGHNTGPLPVMFDPGKSRALDLDSNTPSLNHVCIVCIKVCK